MDNAAGCSTLFSQNQRVIIISTIQYFHCCSCGLSLPYIGSSFILYKSLGVSHRIVGFVEFWQQQR